MWDVSLLLCAVTTSAHIHQHVSVLENRRAMRRSKQVAQGSEFPSRHTFAKMCRRMPGGCGGKMARQRLRARSISAMQQTPPAMATGEAITAVHLPHLNRMRAQNSTNSLLSHPLPIQLRANVDGGGVPPPRVANVTWRNLSVVAPWAQEYATNNLLYHSHMQRLYRQGKLRCITIVKMQSSGTCRDPQTAYKIAALYDAVVERRASAHLLWIDSDAYFQRSLDAAFWGWAAQFDVVDIFRRGTGSMLMPYKHAGGWRRIIGIIQCRLDGYSAADA